MCLERPRRQWPPGLEQPTGCCCWDSNIPVWFGCQGTSCRSQVLPNNQERLFFFMEVWDYELGEDNKGKLEARNIDVEGFVAFQMDSWFQSSYWERQREKCIKTFYHLRNRKRKSERGHSRISGKCIKTKQINRGRGVKVYEAKVDLKLRENVKWC